MVHVQLRQVGAGEGVSRLDRFSLSLERGGVATAWLPDRPAAVNALVRALAGLAPMSGTVELDGHDVSKRPAPKRGVGVVFGGGALFPHLSVRGNLGRGPVDRLAARLELEPWLDRPASRLEGPERFRVALARALMRSPALVVFEDPFPWMAAHAARDLRGLVRDVLRAEGVAGLFVVTEWEDAVACGGLVTAFVGGSPVQAGTASELAGAPAVPALARATGAWVEVGQGAWVPVAAMSVREGGAGLEAVVDHLEPVGASRVWVRAAGRCHAVASDRRWRAGDRVVLTWEPAAVRAFGLDPAEPPPKLPTGPIEAA